MASWRWLLVLWQLSGLQMGESGVTTIKRDHQRNLYNMTLAGDGIYLVSLYTNPNCRGCPSSSSFTVALLRPHATLSLLTVESAKNTGVLAEVATALKEDDVLSLSMSGPEKNPVPFTITYVSGLDGHYTTVVTTSPSNSALLHFNKQLTGGSWRELSGNHASSFSVPTTGMYWVTARVVPDNFEAPVTVMTENGAHTRLLFRIFRQSHVAVSCSGAFYLKAGSVVRVKNPIGATYAAGTLLSFVYLQGNRRPYTAPDEHIAFAGFLTDTLLRACDGVLLFPSHRTDYGGLYASGGNFTIRRSGTYLISVRGVPPPNAAAFFDLIVNDKVTGISFADEGVPSGQTFPVHLDANDRLKVVTRNSCILEAGTLFSIALIST